MAVSEIQDTLEEMVGCIGEFEVECGSNTVTYTGRITAIISGNTGGDYFIGIAGCGTNFSSIPFYDAADGTIVRFIPMRRVVSFAVDYDKEAGHAFEEMKPEEDLEDIVFEIARQGIETAGA